MIELIRVSEKYITEYSLIKSAFNVESIFEIEFRNGGLDGILLNEQKLSKSYLKDYDAYEPPLNWVKKFDLKSWGIFIARNEMGNNVGGVMIACRSNDVILTENRNDIAVIWDIRVNAEYKREGVGKKLFKKAVEFAGSRKCKLLKIETQNSNVPACRFYAEMGCYLGGIRKNFYKEFPEEYQMFWYYNL